MKEVSPRRIGEALSDYYAQAMKKALSHVKGGEGIDHRLLTRRFIQELDRACGAFVRVRDNCVRDE